MLSLFAVLQLAIGAAGIDPLSGGALPLEDGSFEASAREDDECQPGLTCAVHALQRRGDKVLGSSLVAEGRQHSHGVKPEHDLVKGISYGPMPCKSTSCKSDMDDFMAEAAKPLWGPRGRADLKTMRDMGANLVRLYGNNPSEDHSSFLDEAEKQKLKVVLGMSDYPYTQMRYNCKSTGYDCYDLIKAVYRMNLLLGFLKEGKTYHPALQSVIVINEPDLKLPGIQEPTSFVRGIISAVDGMLDAEAEVGVTGPRVNFTATVSFGVCPSCRSFPDSPGLGQMAQIEHGLLHPQEYGYSPKNDLAKFYRSRWIHSFNTAAPAKFVQTDFLEPYEERFPSTPVVVMEYHTPHKNTYKDMKAILDVARNSSLLQGASFFEFQIRYDKGGSEKNFGVWGLGDYNIGSFEYFGSEFSDWCLTPRMDEYGNVAELLTKALGGVGPNYTELCVPDPGKVSLDANGYASILNQGPDRVAIFVERVVQHLGGQVLNKKEITNFAASSVNRNVAQGSTGSTYGAMISYLFERVQQTQHWHAMVRWDSQARCIADRESDAGAVGAAVAYACSKMTAFKCDDVPTVCKGSVWATADYVLDKYYQEVSKNKSAGGPLDLCYFGGAAIFAATDYQGRRCGGSCCTYNGKHSQPPTVAPTLPPIFNPDGPQRMPGMPTVNPALLGDCKFKHVPELLYYWDPGCKAKGGPGCNADGGHMECRFCGEEPFPACPTGDKITTTPAPTTTKNPFAGDCSFEHIPGLGYFWDTSCLPDGGPGCMADGHHRECRLCGQAPFPSCPAQGPELQAHLSSAAPTQGPQTTTPQATTDAPVLHRSAAAPETVESDSPDDEEPNDDDKETVEAAAANNEGIADDVPNDGDEETVEAAAVDEGETFKAKSVEDNYLGPYWSAFGEDS